MEKPAPIGRFCRGEEIRREFSRRLALTGRPTHLCLDARSGRIRIGIRIRSNIGYWLAHNAETIK